MWIWALWVKVFPASLPCGTVTLILWLGGRATRSGRPISSSTFDFWSLTEGEARSDDVTLKTDDDDDDDDDGDLLLVAKDDWLMVAADEHVIGWSLLKL